MELNLPKDPVILLSFVNTQLRDHNLSLSEFCASFGIAEEELAKKLLDIQYRYDETRKQFISI